MMFAVFMTSLGYLNAYCSFGLIVQLITHACLFKSNCVNYTSALMILKWKPDQTFYSKQKGENKDEFQFPLQYKIFKKVKMGHDGRKGLLKESRLIKKQKQ